jgi:phasin
MQPTRFEIPEQMRQMAEETVGQARKAVEEFLDATQKAVSSAEGSARTVREGVADVSRQSLAFIEQNIAASFDLAARLTQARTVEEMTALQQDFLRQQMAAAAEQGKTLGEMANRAAGNLAKTPVKK